MTLRVTSTIRLTVLWHILSWFALWCLPASGSPVDLDAASATFEELILHAHRYGTTKGKRENRKRASRELYARGVDSLRYLMENAHLKNDAVSMFDSKLVREHLTGPEAADVLLDFLDAGEEIVFSAPE